jgi:CheY-like chemotaxis protein
MARTVLIIEDGETFAPLEIALSQLSGVDLLVIRNGREAIQFLEAAPCGLAAIVTDLHLPYVDGFELIERIRSDNRYWGLPIVVLSGDSDPGTPERVRLLGANAFFAKPYSPARVRETLEALLNGT